MKAIHVKLIDVFLAADDSGLGPQTVADKTELTRFSLRNAARELRALGILQFVENDTTRLALHPVFRKGVEYVRLKKKLSTRTVVQRRTCRACGRKRNPKHFTKRKDGRCRDCFRNKIPVKSAPPRYEKRCLQCHEKFTESLLDSRCVNGNKHDWESYLITRRIGPI